MKRIPLILTLAAVLCAAGSCLKDMTGGGGAIFFSASMGGVSTKTEYAGGSYDTGDIEELYWVNGDRIRILCDQASDPSGNSWSDYIVTAASNRTLGSITPANKNGLHVCRRHERGRSAADQGKVEVQATGDSVSHFAHDPGRQRDSGRDAADKTGAEQCRLVHGGRFLGGD